MVSAFLQIKVEDLAGFGWRESGWVIWVLEFGCMEVFVTCWSHHSNLSSSNQVQRFPDVTKLTDVD